MSISLLRPFAVIPKSSLGVDVGTSSLKLVELTTWGERVRLKNYGELQSALLYDKPFRSFEKNSLLLSGKDIARAIRGIMEEAHIQTKRATFSIPDFSSFFTNFELPPMSKEELNSAVQFAARKYVPIPLAEVTFDWQIVGGKFSEDKATTILLVAVPNETVNQYQEIARLAELKLLALEVEVFALLRAALREDKKSVVLLDAGAQSTSISIVEDGVLRNSQSLDIGGNLFTEQISQSLSITYEEANKYKNEKGIRSSSQARDVLLPLLATVVAEIKKLMKEHKERSGKEMEQIIVGGGSAQLPGFVEYLAEELNKKTEIVHPFQSISFPPVLEHTLQEIDPSYAVAVGVALRGLQ